MKLVAFLYLMIILAIPVNILVHAQDYGRGPSIVQDSQPGQLVIQESLNATKQALQEQIQKNEEQRVHYLQIIQSLVALSIGFGCVVIGLVVILYKKRNLKMKQNPES